MLVRSRIVTRSLIALAFAFLFAGPASARDIDGAGSTFVAPIITKWAEDYARHSGVRIDYQSVGSGAGIQKIEAGEVDFGATDKPLDPTELARQGLCQFPIVIGAIVPVVNLPGVKSGQLKFSGQLLADIYMGKITRWDAPEIQALNSGIKLPGISIAVVHRSDGSGTTYNWVDYLSKSSVDWRNKIGIGLSVNWPVGMGANGNAGVSAAVRQTVGAIGYVEYAYALRDKLTFGQVANSIGVYVEPTADALQAAASTINWQNYQDFSVLMTNGGGGMAYPITAATFIVMSKTPKNATKSADALAFFKWALEDGDRQASDLHYVALPPILVLLIEKYWASHIKAGSAGRM